jgi:hypothetical protein
LARAKTTDPVDPTETDDVSGLQDQSGEGAGGPLDPPSSEVDDEQAEPDPTDDESPVPNDEDLDAIDAIEAAATKHENKDIVDAEGAFLRIAAAYPVTTPDAHTVFGFGGLVINLGQLRKLAIGIKQKYRD